ncbi:Phosphoglucan phosphatase LSF2 chloroplastic [Bienertia sinuspersici]
MKKMMRNPYEYHHDLGMNYTLIHDNLIVGSQPQKPEDIDHLKSNENVAYILNLQQDKDIDYWGIDFDSILKRCEKIGICHMRRPAKDFDPDSLRTMLPKAVSALQWAMSEGKGRVYVHCTAGLGRAPAVAIAYMFWFCGMDILSYLASNLAQTEAGKKCAGKSVIL